MFCRLHQALSMRTDVIIAAAGRGSRMEHSENKLLLPLGTQTVLEHTVSIFARHPQVARVLVTVSPEDEPRVATLLERFSVHLVRGGATRQASVHAALEALERFPEACEWVLVQDGARPFTTPELISRVLEATQQVGAAIPVVSLNDTIRRIDGVRMELLDRSVLRAVQTPQGARRQTLWEASTRALQERWEVTDDASLIERFGGKVAWVEGERSNLKLTTLEDYAFARWKAQSG
jgi:2-C-methyl-D-erythritol 4-phosphate cytidylyltransferase